MHRLAFHPVTRALLHGAVRIVRPFRFVVGLSRRVNRPLEELLGL